MLLSLDSPPPDGGTSTNQPTPQQLPALSLEETLQAVAFPPTGVNLGPRVEHVQVAAAGLLSEAVANALQLPQSFVLELIRFGAVHYCPVMPPPSPKAAPRMSPAHLERMQQLRAAGIARHGKSPKLQVPQRIMGGDCEVHEGGYIRVHVHPKRFPAADSLDWRQAVVADRPEYVVVDKPAGVQVPPTVDNMLESVVALTAGALGLPPESLCNTHRLDVGTSGIVVLAKSPGFAAWFSGLLSNKPGAVVKTYRCLSAAPPPLGRMVHWAVVKQRAAGEPPHTRVLLGGVGAAAGGAGAGEQEEEGDEEGPVEGAVRCELIVEQVEQVSLTGAAAAEWGPVAYESTLQLVTGRTHQIRAQMAAVQCPLLGDQLYTALADMWQQEQQQQVQQQPEPQQQEQQVQPLQGGGQQPQQQQDNDGGSAQHRHAGAHWSKVYQTDPSRPIGLQAARLKVRNAGGRMTAAAAPQPPQPTPVGEESAVAEASDGTEQVLMRRGSSKSKDRKNKKRQQQEGSDDISGVGVGESGVSDAAPPPPGEPEWVEFEAGIPWWRA